MEGMKHFGWVVVDRDGDSFDVVYEKEAADEQLREFTKVGHFPPYRVVELFYKDEQS